MPVVPKILVVDDDTKACINLKRLFKALNCVVEVAYSGEEALAKVNVFAPHIALLDIRMPVLTGDKLVKMIKALKPGIEIIMTTAVTDIELLNECLANGAIAIIEKPIQFEELHAKVLEVFKKCRN